MRRTLAPHLLAAVALPLLWGAQASAADESGSIYTDNSYELRRDDRVFALFAALNAAGYDVGDPARAHPFPRYAYHPLREKVRQALAGEQIRPAVERYLDAHQETLDSYVAAALTLGTDSSFTATGRTPRAFDGLDRMLAEVAGATHLQKLSKSLSNDYRELFKKLKPVVDGPFAKLRAGYRLKEEDAPNLILVPNPLDTPGTAVARKAADGSHVVVFGLPAGSAALDVQPLLRAYSELLAQEATATVAVAGIDDALQKLRARGTLSHDVTAENMVRESLRTAVESHLWSKDPEADVDAAAARGLLYSRVFLEALTEPADAYPATHGPFAVQVTGRVELRKLVDSAQGIDAGP